MGPRATLVAREARRSRARTGSEVRLRSSRPVYPTPGPPVKACPPGDPRTSSYSVVSTGSTQAWVEAQSFLSATHCRMQASSSETDSSGTAARTTTDAPG